MIYQRRPSTTAAPSSTTTTLASTAVAPRRHEHDLSSSNNNDSMALSDPVLDFGFSVEMCDSTRRSVELETNELASAINSAKDEIAKENRVSQQLDTDLTHADAEMKNTKRKATDLLENSGLQDHLLQPLTGTLTEITAPVSLTSISTNEANTIQNNRTTSGNPICNSESNKVVTFQNILEEQRGEMKKRAEAIKDRKEALERLHYQICETDQEKQRMLQNTEGMVEELAKVKKSSQESQAVLELEQQRVAKYKEALEQTRSSGVKETAEGDKLEKQLAQEKAANEAKEKELQEQENVAAKEYEDLLNTVSAQEAERDQLNREWEELTRVVAECERLHKQEEEIKIERERILQETSTLQQQQDEATLQLAAVTEKLNESEEQLRDLTTAEAALEAETLENDKVYAEQILPGQAEMAELSKEKEQLVSLVDEMEEKIAAHKKTVDEAVANIMESQEATEENLKTVQAEIESMRLMRCEVQQEHEKSHLAAMQELEDIEALTKQLEDANEAEQKRLDEFEAGRAANRQARLREANDEIDREHADLKQILDVLIYTKDVFKKTTKEKERILSTVA